MRSRFILPATRRNSYIPFIAEGLGPGQIDPAPARPGHESNAGAPRVLTSIDVETREREAVVRATYALKYV